VRAAEQDTYPGLPTARHEYTGRSKMLDRAGHSSDTDGKAGYLSCKFIYLFGIHIPVYQPPGMNIPGDQKRRIAPDIRPVRAVRQDIHPALYLIP